MPSKRPASPGCGVRIQFEFEHGACASRVERIGIDDGGFVDFRSAVIEQRLRPLVLPKTRPDREHVGALDQRCQIARAFRRPDTSARDDWP